MNRSISVFADVYELAEHMKKECGFYVTVQDALPDAIKIYELALRDRQNELFKDAFGLEMGDAPFLEAIAIQMGYQSKGTGLTLIAAISDALDRLSDK